VDLTIWLTTDAARWRDALDAWQVMAHREGVAANLDAAKNIQRRTRSNLARFHHRPLTRTPSPPGEPPAMIGGRLAASVLASQDGDDAVVGPTVFASSKNGPYGRFLEMGGEQAGHDGDMWWWQDGYWYHAESLTKAPRPYLKPATDDAIRSGDIYEIYWRHWLYAQEAITGAS
jgi:hypothetical protein